MKTYFIEDQEQVERIISTCSTCFVGVVDLQGEPYVVPMNFGYHAKTLYLHSAPNGNLVKIIQQNPAVCITFSLGEQLTHQHPKVACSYRIRAKSVICKGKVQFITNPTEKVEILDVIMHKYVPGKLFSYSEPAIKNVLIWKIPIDTWTAKEFGAPHSKAI